MSMIIENSKAGVPDNSKFAIMHLNVFIYMLVAHSCGRHKPVDAKRSKLQWKSYEEM